MVKKIKKEIDDPTILRRLITRSIKDCEEMNDHELSSSDRSEMVGEVYDILAPGFFMLLTNITINEFEVYLGGFDDDDDTEDGDAEDDEDGDEEDDDEEDGVQDADFEEVEGGNNEAA